MRRIVTLLVAVALVLLAAAAPAGGVPEGPEYPSPEWFERESRNYAKTQEEPETQMASPGFQVRWNAQGTANLATYLERSAAGTWPWEHRGNLCAYWNEQCTGEPFLYPGVDPFYEQEGEVVEFAFYDSQGALLSGRVWAPADVGAGAELPGVVIETGSVQAPETLYWWFAQTLVRNGYTVMTYDVRGQGRSDNRTPDGAQGSNANPSVFVTNLVDAVDLFRSTPDATYAHNATFDRVSSDLVVPHNPLWHVLDRDRIAIVGHSLGATGVSVVQGLEPWPGSSGWGNPMVEHYSLAWLDRWLKEVGEPGHDTADERLLADADWTDRMSFYLHSARWFPDRSGTLHHCEDIRAGCDDAAALPEVDGGTEADGGTPDGGSAALPATGGGAAVGAALLWAAALGLRRRRYPNGRASTGTEPDDAPILATLIAARGRPRRGPRQIDGHGPG